MFASEIRKQVQVGEDTVTIRKLSGASLRKANEAWNIDQTRSLRDMGADVVKAMRGEELEAVAKQMRNDSEARRRMRYISYDREFVLNAGIVSWTHERKVNPEAIADLDEETAEKLHREILDLSLPSLDPAEAAAIEAKG